MRGRAALLPRVWIVGRGTLWELKIWRTHDQRGSLIVSQNEFHLSNSSDSPCIPCPVPVLSLTKAISKRPGIGRWRLSWRAGLTWIESAIECVPVNGSECVNLMMCHMGSWLKGRQILHRDSSSCWRVWLPLLVVEILSLDQSCKTFRKLRIENDRPHQFSLRFLGLIL